MFKKIFIYSGLLFLFYAIIAAIIVIIQEYDKPDVFALIVAGVLALINLFLTVFFIKKNIKKSNADFIKGFFLGTLVRLVLLVAIFFAVVLQLPLNHFVFGISFFILYLLFQIVEIYFLHTNKDLAK